jgi:hypothetical protein
VTDADVIDILREAAEALAIASALARTDAHIAELHRVAGDCLDAATFIARRDQISARP